MDRAKIVELKEKRATAWEAAKNLLNDVSEGGWTDELRSTSDRIEQEISDLDTEVRLAEATFAAEVRDAEVVEERTENTGAGPEEYDSIFRKYIVNGLPGLEDNEKLVLRGGFVSQENRALGIATGAAGGYTVPEGFWNRVSEAQLAYGGMMEVARVITTATGNDLPWMTADDTSNTGAILAENTQISEQDVTWGVRTLGAYLYTSKLIRVSYQLLQDSAVDVEGYLANVMATRLGRIHNTHFTTGTGSAQPDGIVTGATTGKTTASATAITFNEVVDLVHSIDPSYRSGPNVRFMLNDGVLAYLRKVKDDTGGSGLGRPLWEPSVQVGEPDLIYGVPYVINQDMASTVASTNTTMLFGDFTEGYVIRRVKGMQMVRLDERYADYLQVGFFGFDRMDGTKDNTSAYKALVQAA